MKVTELWEKKYLFLSKFVPLNIENIEENRRTYRELLFSAEGIENYISGVILFDETARQSDKNGKKFIDVLTEKNMVPGIKVDEGIQIIPNTQEENWTAGMDTLAKRAAEYYQMGNLISH
jgi:fructose-bisphosphate aldolase class I